jgi:hypothetical protein
MRKVAFTGLFVAMAFVAGNAYALKELVRVTPDNLEGTGFSLVQETKDDGTLAFTITRELAKAKTFPADSELEVRRNATLTVYGDSGVAVLCGVEPMSDEAKQTVRYYFVLGKDYASRSNFTVAEIDDYKDRGRERLLGGGSFFEFRLADFLSDEAKSDTPGGTR